MLTDLSLLPPTTPLETSSIKAFQEAKSTSRLLSKGDFPYETYTITTHFNSDEIPGYRSRMTPSKRQFIRHRDVRENDANIPIIPSRKIGL